MQLTDAHTLAAVRDLTWLARHITDGGLFGAQRSRRRGAGLEFQQYRGYQPGDPIRNIDWKLFARSDRYFVRESERESQMHVCFVLDTSASMAQPSLDVPALKKMHYARAWIASLAWLLTRQGDRFSLLALNDREQRRLAAGRGERHHRQLALELSRTRAQGEWPAESQLSALWSHCEQPCQVVLVSDFFERAGEISEVAARLQAAGRDCLPLQLLIQAETSFPFAGDLSVRDPEAGGSVEINAERQRAEYLHAFRAAGRALAGKFSQWQTPLLSTAIERPLEESLRRFLSLHSRVA